MSTVEEIQSVIETLPPDEFSRLRQWFTEKDWEQWDKQIEEDSASGRLDYLEMEALNGKNESSSPDL